MMVGMSDESEQTESEPAAEIDSERPIQFTIQHLLFWTTMVAIFLAVGIQINFVLGIETAILVFFLRRRWLTRHSLKAKMTYLLIVGVLFGPVVLWLCIKIKESEAKQQKAALDWVVNNGGTYLQRPDPSFLFGIPGLDGG